MLAVLTISAAVLVPQVIGQAPAPGGQAPAPATSSDAKAFQIAEALVQEGKWKEAMDALEKFRDQNKMLSPFSRPAKYLLAISYLRQDKPLHDSAVAELRPLLTDQKVDPAMKEQAQLLIAKALTMKGAELQSETDAQKTAQARIFEQAIKEYEQFLTSFPQSRSGDTAHFLRATLLLNVERFEDAVKGFSVVYQRYGQSPLRMPALLNIGKTFMSQGYSLMATKKGKEASEADMKRGLTILETNALPSLTEAYRLSQDLAIMNEAIYYIGQIQLSRSQNVDLPDEAAAKKKQSDLLGASLDGFRAVRSREEVIQAQQDKINALKKAIQLLTPGTPEYFPAKSNYENLIDLEEQKKTEFLTKQDQFLGARLAIARIFLFLKKPDECRALLRYLQGQKELLEKEKDAQATIAALLCLTYIEQKNAPKAQETYDAFRAGFKGHLDGDNLPLLLANLYLELDQADKAEELVAQGKQDYAQEGGWRFQTEANQILIAAFLKKSQFEKGLQLCDEVLSGSPKPSVEVQTLYLKGSVQRAMAAEKGMPKLAEEALTSFQVIRDKYPSDPKAEDAWAEQCGILAGRDPAKAKTELENYLSQYGSGGGKSENTKANVAIAQYRLGQVLTALGKPDDAVAAYRAVVEKWPESEPAPGAFFKMFDIQNERKDYAACVKLMEEFIQKYPEHENVYYAFNNLAEFHYSGLLKTRPDGKSVAAGIEDTEAGAKKHYEYVDYELAKSLKVKRGDDSLVKVADRWIKELGKLPAYVTLNGDQKVVWQKSIEGIVAAAERLLKSYADSDKLGDGLERLATAQKQMLKAQVITANQGEEYFRKLIEQYGTSNSLKAKILFALGGFLQDVDMKKARQIREEAIKLIEGEEPSEKAIPMFPPGDWDHYLTDLFETKNFERLGKFIARIRKEYPLADGATTEDFSIQNGQAVALFWEAKVLAEQGKAVEAGNLFARLAKDFPKSTKVFEADYGIIYGKVTSGTIQDDYIPRLTKIVNNVRDVKTFELPAKSLLLIGDIQVELKEYEAAISTYTKISNRYASVPSIAGEGLWKAGQLLEKQATGALPVRTQKELQALGAAKAEKAKAAKAKEEAEKKKPEAKPAAPPGVTDAKSGDKPVAKADSAPAKP